MPDCPRCHQPVESEAIACPHCRAELKAFGHPGIPLYQSAGSLCPTCLYHDDDTCTFPQRPHATTCTLYTTSEAPPRVTYRPRSGTLVRGWLRQHGGWLLLLAVVVVSIVVAVTGA